MTAPGPGGDSRAASGPITRFFAEDHRRLDHLLQQALAHPGEIEMRAFAAFREGLLRHIAWEEKILLRAARAARGDVPLEMARRLRIDHGALALLLVPTPTPELADEIVSILSPHNAFEEGPGGLYEVCEALLAAKAGELLDQVRAYPPVKLAPHFDGPGVFRRAEDALRTSALQYEPRRKTRT
jgi:hypothetical protein